MAREYKIIGIAGVTWLTAMALLITAMVLPGCSPGQFSDVMDKKQERVRGK